MDYIQIAFFTKEEALREMLIALLTDEGFEGFLETDETLIATIPGDAYKQEVVTALATAHHIHFEEQIIPKQNWNAVWEASFQPVIVNNFCTVRAQFHELPVTTPYEIVITPKMSFGTGHHATTQLMIEGMQNLSFQGLNVLDFGTGTGILAILACQLGAAYVTGIDNDEWSLVNAQENAAFNGCSIALSQASLEDLPPAHYDIILANINRNILLQYMESMRDQIVDKGLLLLSGILEADQQAIKEAAVAAGLSPQWEQSRNGWMALCFQKG